MWSNQSVLGMRHELIWLTSASSNVTANFVISQIQYLYHNIMKQEAQLLQRDTHTQNLLSLWVQN